MILTPLTIAFIALQVADAVTTYIFMSDITDGLTEGNKALLWLMEKVGVAPALAIVKLLLIALVLFMPLSNALLGMGVAVYLVVVGRNLSMMRRT